MPGPLRSLADATVRLPVAIARGFLVALVPGLALLLLRVALAGAWQVPASARPPLAFAAYSVLIAPLIETAGIQAIAFLQSRAGVRVNVQVASITLLAALAHAAAGSWWNGLFAAWPFLVYAILLCAWRARSERAAFVVVATVHALYNAAFVLLVVLAAGRSG